MEKIKYHITLARYFSAKSLWLEKDKKEIPNIRKLVELPWQEVKGKMREEISETLSDLLFIEAKCINKLFYDLLLDFDHCNLILGISDLNFVRQAVSSSVSGLFLEPDHYLSMLWNRLKWLLPAHNVPEVIQTNLDKAYRKLMNSPAWLHALAPLPETKKNKINEFPLDAVIYQSLNMSTQKLAITDGLTTLDILDIRTGESIIKKTVNNQNIIGISISTKDNRIVTIDKSGLIYLDQIKTEYHSRKNEHLIEWVSGYLIFVRDDDCLVAWEIAKDEIYVLLKDIPRPIVLLKTETEAAVVLIAAGYRKQVFGYVKTDPCAGFFEITVPLSTPIVAGDISTKNSLVAVTTADSTIYLINISQNNIIKKCSYTYETGSRLRGMAKKVAFGSGATANTLFIATDSGQVWNWIYTMHQFKSYGEFKGHKEGSSLICLGIWPDTGLPFVSSENNAQTLAETDQGSNLDQPVTDVCLTDNKQIVAIKYDGHTVCVYSSEGLEKTNQLHLNWPTSVTYCHRSDTVWVGCKSGIICKITTEKKDEIVVADSVIGIFDSTDSDMIWVAQENGDIICIPAFATDIREDKKRTKILWNSLGYETRHKVIPASDNDTFWCLSQKETEQGLNISLINAKQNAVTLDRGQDYTDIAVSPFYNLFATSGYSIKIYSIACENFELMYSSDTPAKHISFLNDGMFLITANENWLHVHRVTRGLPIVAAHDLTSWINCLATNNMNITAGLQSGEIVSFRLEINLQ